MSQLYARVFVQILDSSLAEDWQARHVFEDLLKLADDGVVEITRQALSRRTNTPIEIINDAIAKLEAPDAASRDAAEDGRRIVRLDEHRDWGWRIVNWVKYAQIRSAADQRAQTRERVRRYRERRQQSNPPPAPPPPKPETEREVERSLQTVTAPLPAPPTAGAVGGHARAQTPCWQDWWA
jgi:hypothetical protein